MAGIINFPWCIKPVFGYIFDQIIRKFKKTKYIIFVTCLVRIVCFSYLANAQLTVFTFYLFSLIISFASLFENIICEYLLLISTKHENSQNQDSQANHLPIFFGFRALGSIIGSFSGGRIIQQYSNSTAFTINSLSPLVLISVAILYQEVEHRLKQTTSRTFRQEFNLIIKLISRDKVFQMIIFLCLLNMTPSFDSMITFYMTDYLKFTSTDLANFNSIGTIFYVVGLLMYSFYFRKLNPKKFFLITNFILWIINVSFMTVLFHILQKYNISDKFFCFLNQGVQSFIAEINFMPIIAIWCQISPDNLEATSITLFTGLMNLSYNLSNYIGSGILWILNMNEKSLERLWLPLTIQNVYLLVMTVAIVFVQFPKVNQKIKTQIEN